VEASFVEFSTASERLSSYDVLRDRGAKKTCVGNSWGDMPSSTIVIHEDPLSGYFILLL
jgi:hypothetical protein